MNIPVFLVVSSRGSVRVTKRRPPLSNNEIAIRFNLKIPREFFDRLMPTVDLELPKESVVNPDSEMMIRIAAEKVSESLQIDYQEVQDGLAEMVKRSQEKNRG